MCTRRTTPQTTAPLRSATAGQNFVVLALLVVFAITAFSADVAQMPKPIIIAHRGASGYLPEHTLEAKAMAHAMGADYLEQDLVLSKDGVPVVLHDIYLDTITDVAKQFPKRKRTDGRYYAIDFTVAELKQLRVTERFNPNTGEAVFKNRYPLWRGAFQLHTFEDELQFIQGLNKSTGRDVGIYPEIKQPAWHRKEGQGISKAVVPILDRYGYRTKADQIFLQCFDFDEVIRLRNELGYRGRLIQLLDDKAENKSLRTRSGLEQIATVADGIGPAIAHLVAESGEGVWATTSLVSDAHALKLVVHPYTMRRDELPKFASSWEELHSVVFDKSVVDGAFTDFPDLTSQWLRTNVTNQISK